MSPAAWLVLTLAAAPACIGSSVLDDEQRAISSATAELTWRTATADDLAGLYESVSIEGEAASALWKVYYHFDAGGSYTGAALVIGGTHPEFQTLSGSWKLENGLLELGEEEPLRVFAAPEHLKLESPTGVAILRRVVLQ